MPEKLSERIRGECEKLCRAVVTEDDEWDELSPNKVADEVAALERRLELETTTLKDSVASYTKLEEEFEELERERDSLKEAAKQAGILQTELSALRAKLADAEIGNRAWIESRDMVED